MSYRTYYQEFDLIENKGGDKQYLSLTTVGAGGKSTKEFGYKVDFSVRTTDVAMEQELPVIFVGYGFTDRENGYDDYKGVDVKGKLVIRLSGYPGHQDTTSKAHRTFNPRGEINGIAALIEIDPDQNY